MEWKRGWIELAGVILDNLELSAAEADEYLHVADQGPGMVRFEAESDYTVTAVSLHRDRVRELHKWLSEWLEKA